jgi:hypothetical protein
MNETDFEAQLKADGYTEIETQNLDPRPGKGRHRHLFAIRGLVLSGAFIVTQDREPVTYGPGQIFGVAEGNCTTSRSDQKARGCWWVASSQKRGHPPNCRVWAEGQAKMKQSLWTPEDDKRPNF